jgi:spermidine synthase
MAAYVVTARIEAVRPHVACAPGAAAATWSRVWAARSSDDRLVDTTAPGQRDLALRWEAIRERWSQLTFFLFDPESWR